MKIYTKASKCMKDTYYVATIVQDKDTIYMHNISPTTTKDVAYANTIGVRQGLAFIHFNLNNRGTVELHTDLEKEHLDKYLDTLKDMSTGTLAQYYGNVCHYDNNESDTKYMDMLNTLLNVQERNNFAIMLGEHKTR